MIHVWVMYQHLGNRYPQRLGVVHTESEAKAWVDDTSSKHERIAGVEYTWSINVLKGRHITKTCNETGCYIMACRIPLELDPQELAKQRLTEKRGDP